MKSLYTKTDNCPLTFRLEIEIMMPIVHGIQPTGKTLEVVERYEDGLEARQVPKFPTATELKEYLVKDGGLDERYLNPVSSWRGETELYEEPSRMRVYDHFLNLGIPARMECEEHTKPLFLMSDKEKEMRARFATKETADDLRLALESSPEESSSGGEGGNTDESRGDGTSDGDDATSQTTKASPFFTVTHNWSLREDEFCDYVEALSHNKPNPLKRLTALILTAESSLNLVHAQHSYGACPWAPHMQYFNQINNLDENVWVATHRESLLDTVATREYSLEDCTTHYRSFETDSRGKRAQMDIIQTPRSYRGRLMLPLSSAEAILNLETFDQPSNARERRFLHGNIQTKRRRTGQGKLQSPKHTPPRTGLSQLPEADHRVSPVRKLHGSGVHHHVGEGLPGQGILPVPPGLYNFEGTWKRERVADGSVPWVRLQEEDPAEDDEDEDYNED
ncbi:hypothetical protein MKZ38_004322 [Zalerion maritima]|uniref:Uncharacterized protein n=1 Tax=Zalerion maritima TaxID=339359 RepID=A0AAD5RLR2_9PEZI|nr:hypothetical protein MKZ38_004322 [Zalerion maritima]